jgi:hypothetical protein
MAIPSPRVGMVIRHSFLFSNGEEKERPAVVIVAVDPANAGDPLQVAVMPITHSPPLNAATALEIPARLKNHLKLDDDRSWVVIDEINEFVWPGYDLRQIPGNEGSWEYGQMPPGFIRQISDCVEQLEKQNRLHLISRD